MAYKPTAEYDIRAKDETKGGIQSASMSLDNFGKSVGSAFKNIAKITAAGAAAITGAVLAFNKLTDVYGKQEQAQIKLAAAAKNNPLVDGRAVKGLMAYASSLQKVSTYGDEALLPFMSMGVAMGHTEETIKKVSQAAIDLAAGTGMSLDAAFKNLYKTFGGMTGELGESIPALKDFTQEQLKAGAAVDFVTKQYSGMAASVAESTLGIKEQTKNIFGDMLESVGKGLAPIGNIVIKSMQPAFQAIGKWFEDNSQQITNFFLHFGEIARIVINRVGEGFKKMFTWDWVLNYVSTVFDGIKNIFASLIKFAVNLVIAVGTTIWLPLSKGFEWVCYGIRVAWQGMINGIAKGINWLVENPIDAIAVAFETVVHAIGESIQWILNGIISLINGVITGLNAVIEGAHDAVQALQHPFDADKREKFTGGIGQLGEMNIEWLDPKLHKKLTTGLKDWIVELKDVPKPKEEWDDIAAKIKEVWTNTADSGIDVFQASLSSIMDIGEVMAEPFVEAFSGFSVEFKEILLRELPPEAVSAFEEVLTKIEDAAPKPQLSKWEILTNYISTQLKNIADKFKAAIPVVKSGVEGFVSSFADAIKNPGKALSNVFTFLKEGIGRAGISLINKIKGVDIETGKKIETEEGEKKPSLLAGIGAALAKFGSWLLDMISSTEALTQVFDYLSEALVPMFETIATPLAQALMPVIQLLVSFASQVVTLILPVIEAVADLIGRLIEPLQDLFNSVMNILQPIINLIITVLDVVGDLLIQIMPAIQTVIDAFVNILTPIINFIAQILTALAPLFKMIGDILLAVAPIIEAIGYVLNAILGPALTFIADLISAVLTPIVNILSNVLTVLVPIIQIFSNLMKAMAPIFNILFTVLNVLLIPIQVLGSLLELLNPIFAILAGIIDFLNPVIVFFAKVLDAATRPIEFVGDLLQWLGNGLKALGQAIWYLITFQWDKMGDIRWQGAFESDAFTRPLIDINDITTPTIDLAAGNGLTTGTATTDTTGYSGTGASYGVNTYNVNITINTDVIAGEGGIRDLALMIDTELESLRTQGMVA